MADERFVETGPEGHAAFQQMQEVYTRAHLTADDGLCAACDFLVWVLLTSIPKKENVIAQFEELIPALRKSIDDNWPSVEARRKMLAALDAGESGGRLQ